MKALLLYFIHLLMIIIILCTVLWLFVLNVFIIGYHYSFMHLPMIIIMDISCVITIKSCIAWLSMVYGITSVLKNRNHTKTVPDDHLTYNSMMLSTRKTDLWWDFRTEPQLIHIKRWLCLTRAPPGSYTDITGKRALSLLSFSREIKTFIKCPKRTN